MASPLIWLIVGMAVVTYLPRMLPLVLINSQRLPSFVKAILMNVPIAMLGALIFPGIFHIHENWQYGLVGGLAAVVVTLFTRQLIVVIGCSILVLTLFVILFHS